MIAIVFIAGCSDSKKPAASSSSGARAGQPAVGGTLRLGIERPKTLDPGSIPASARTPSQLMVADLLFDGLTHMDDGAVSASPAIASAWTASADQKSFQFTLRPDARFSNGRGITATDVKYSLERVAKQGETSLAALRLDAINGFGDFIFGTTPGLAGIRAVDDHTVAFDLGTPFAVLPELLSAPEYGIVPKEAVDSPSPAFASAPVTSGPFSYAGTQGDVVKLVRATQGSAYLDGIELHEYDAANLGKSYDDFTQGNLDWSVVPADRAEDALRRFGPDQFRPFDAQTIYAFNLLDPAFANTAFRQAILKAVDRSAIAKAIFPGTADASNSIVPAGVAGHVDAPCGDACAYNADASRAILAQLYPDGNLPTFNLDYSKGSPDEAVAGAIAANLTAVGLHVNLDAMDIDAYAQFPSTGHAQLFRLGEIGLYPSPDPYLTLPFISGSRENATGFSDANVEHLLQTARATADASARQGFYQQAEQAIMALVPTIPVVQIRSTAVASAKLHDFTITVNGSISGDKVWLEAS